MNKKGFLMLFVILALAIGFIVFLTSYKNWEPKTDNNSSGPGYEMNKEYIYKDKDKCKIIDYACDNGWEPFSDSIGCGCIKKENNQVSEKHYCQVEERGAQICTMDYSPVCGYFNKGIQCIKAPCGGTYSNRCNACADEKVEYWTNGECLN